MKEPTGNDRFYNAWREGKGPVRITAGFADRVMGQVCKHKCGSTIHLVRNRELLRRLSGYRAVRAGLVATGVVMGVVRTGLIIVLLLR